ncbi:hypothetical protein BGW36DRAFT_379110 [Talaromyces proteolyticus]|uniref:NADH dehydrogenase [ubiquinone] 1 alpha subcomplex subunit 1 n=1 Tax=Talaromyces proteolyticus TaxID=1131652 RepID=A0AAD4KV70_9EURO|nr:uncharacterized protein BGW36DRAFT_379110 [Talaromyces proteolyticus]KAH8697630.1 hypothetical protein BGW36DRAFT_379110 [Talaromyces proteolyticus]
MGVPFEALLPYGIIVGMYAVTGVGLSVTKYFVNDHKKARWNRDAWDKITVMERDLRITGSWRGQSTNPEAPAGFEVSNPWRLEKRTF